MGTFGKTEITVPRARLATADGKTHEWRIAALRAYQRRTLAADALIAGSYLAGSTNTRRVRRALAAVFAGAVSKGHGELGVAQGDERLGRPECPLARRGADRAAHSRRHRGSRRLDRKATYISLLVVIGAREDGQKILLAVKGMGGENTEAWRAVLDDLVMLALRRP